MTSPYPNASYPLIGGPLENQEVKLPHEMATYGPFVNGREEIYRAIRVSLFARNFQVLVHTSLIDGAAQDALADALAHAMLSRPAYTHWQNGTLVQSPEEAHATVQQDAVR